MKEFTWRALLLGLVMCVVLGAANAYLGLRAGQTIAATYPAAVIGMAVLRVFKGSILEENIARTAGSIGESVAAGAVFTLPAFVMVKAWGSFDSSEAYWKSTALMLVGSVLGVLFVSLIRRVMVEDPELPFPESVAASEDSQGGTGAARKRQNISFTTWLSGPASSSRARSGCYAPDQDFFFQVGQLGRSVLRLGAARLDAAPGHRRRHHGGRAHVSPAYIGVGYIIGPELAALNFSGSVVAWGLLIPLLIYFLGPQIANVLAGGCARGGLARPGQRRLALHRASHRCRQHDGGHVLHAVPHA